MIAGVSPQTICALLAVISPVESYQNILLKSTILNVFADSRH